MYRIFNLQSPLSFELAWKRSCTGTVGLDARTYTSSTSQRNPHLGLASARLCSRNSIRHGFEVSRSRRPRKPSPERLRISQMRYEKPGSPKILEPSRGRRYFPSFCTSSGQFLSAFCKFPCVSLLNLLRMSRSIASRADHSRFARLQS